MGILYGMVAREEVVLAEFNASPHANAGTLARQILSKVPPSAASNASYSHDRYIFHVTKSDGLTALCMAEDSFERRIPFAFLQELRLRFVATFGKSILSAPPYAMNDQFSRIIHQLMDHYSTNPNADTLNRLKNEMTQVRSVMIDNIDKVLARGDRLALLVDKVSTLHGNTLRFKRQTRRYRNTIWWQNCRLTFALCGFVSIIVYAAAAYACNDLLVRTCFG